MERKEFIRKQFTAVDGTVFTVTYCKITGKGPGRTLTLVAGQHGMEHSGPNILQKFLFDVDPDSFNGTLYICPCLNPVALLHDYEIFPEGHDLGKLKDYYYSLYRHDYCVFGEGRLDKQTYFNMNRLWNLKEKHGVAWEVAKYIWDELVLPADVVADFHAAISEKPFMYFGNKPDILPFVGRLGVEGIYGESNPDTLSEYYKHTLAQQVNESGRIGFTVEFGLQHFLKESEYPVGFKAIENMMKNLKMIPGQIYLRRPTWYINKKEPVMAHHTGHVRFYKTNYDKIVKGERLFEIWDIETLELLETGYAPFDGIITWKNYKPVQQKETPCCLVSYGPMVCDEGPQQALEDDFCEKIRAIREKEYPASVIPLKK